MSEQMKEMDRMERRMVEQVKVMHLDVSVADNTRQDRLLGGPSTIGFDFLVDPSSVSEIRELIEEEVKKLGLPYCNITEVGERWVFLNQVWDDEQIMKCIREEGAKMKRYLK